VIVVDDPSQAVWRRSVDVAFVDDGERVVLLTLGWPGASHPRLLAGSSALIWRLLDSGKSTEELVGDIRDYVATSVHDVQDDVARFLLVLEQEGLTTRNAS
jgi:hypothetical protein